MRGDGLPLRAQVLLDAVAGREPIGERAGLVRQRLFEALDLVAPLAHVRVRLGGSRMCLFPGFERGFLAQALGVALGLAHEAIGFGVGARQGVVGDAPAAGRPPDARHQRYDERNEDEEGNEREQVERDRRTGR